MSLKDKTLALLLSIAFCFIIFLPGCGKCGYKDKDVIAYVNKEPVFETELKRSIAMKARQDPMFKVTPQVETDELETIIEKKIIIQGAIKKSLARESRFVNTIKNFWEQTLIRDFIDYKRKEFQDYLFATEDEIKNYYDNLPQKPQDATLDSLRPEIEKRIMDEKESKLFADWLKQERKKASVRIIKK